MAEGVRFLCRAAWQCTVRPCRGRTHADQGRGCAPQPKMAIRYKRVAPLAQWDRGATRLLVRLVAQPCCHLFGLPRLVRRMDLNRCLSGWTVQIAKPVVQRCCSFLTAKKQNAGAAVCGKWIFYDLNLGKVALKLLCENLQRVALGQ